MARRRHNPTALVTTLVTLGAAAAAATAVGLAMRRRRDEAMANCDVAERLGQIASGLARNPTLVGQVKPQGYAAGDQWWIHGLDYEGAFGEQLAGPNEFMNELHAYSPAMNWGGTLSVKYVCYSAFVGCSEYNTGGAGAVEIKENGHIGGQWYTCRWTRDYSAIDSFGDWQFAGCTPISGGSGGGMSKQHPGGGLYQEPKDEPLRRRGRLTNGRPIGGLT